MFNQKLEMLAFEFKHDMAREFTGAAEE